MGYSTVLTFFCVSITLLSLVKCVRCQHAGEVIIPVDNFLPEEVRRSLYETKNVSANVAAEAEKAVVKDISNIERTPRLEENENNIDDIENAVDEEAARIWRTIIPLSRAVRDTNAISTPNQSDAATTGQFESRKKYGAGTKYKFGRKKLGKKKHLKWLYPVFIGIFISKLIILPMIIKAVTFMSSTSFVLSKMSLLATVILGLKFFLTNNNQAKMNDSRVEIIHVPIKKDYSSTWDRETAENRIHPQYHPPQQQQQDAQVDNEFKPTQYNMNFE